MGNKFWADWEIELLVRMWPKHTAREISDLLALRSVNGIRQKAWNLGLPVEWRADWQTNTEARSGGLASLQSHDLKHLDSQGV